MMNRRGAVENDRVESVIAATRSMLAEGDLLRNRAEKWPDISLDTYQGTTFQILESIGKVGTAKTWRMLHGEEQHGSIFAEVLSDSAKSIATGYVTSFIGSGVQIAAEKAGWETVTRYNSHLAIAAGIVQSSKSLIAYLDNRIDAGQMLDEINQTVVHGTASFYYGAVAQTVIALPIAGALVGSTVGYFVGTMLYQSGLLSLGAPVEFRYAEERRHRIEEMCLHALPLIQLHRDELQRLVEENCHERAALFQSVFTVMDRAFEEQDPVCYVEQLEVLCAALGAGLPFSSFPEFDRFMNDTTTVFAL